MENALTEATIQSALPGSKLKRLFDGGGLYIEIHPHGGKWWRLKYCFDGKENRISLGVYPGVSLQAARELATKAKERLSAGFNPSTDRKAEKTKAMMRERRAAEKAKQVALESANSLFMTAADVMECLRITRKDLDLLVASGEIPQPRRFGPKLLRWVRAEIEELGNDLDQNETTSDSPRG